MMSESLNICRELRCPFARRSGCSRFVVSQHCPLAQDPAIEANQYWLFADVAASFDINHLRDVLQSEVLADESSQRQLWAEEHWLEEKPVMAWE